MTALALLGIGFVAGVVVTLVVLYLMLGGDHPRWVR